jgi:hypothetical protein
MNPDTGHLVADLSELKENVRKDYRSVPAPLRNEASRALAGKRETTINLNAQTNLAQWAANERKKNRSRARIAKKSRARNRT